jgi:predicted transcriptional regulator of viral defense system
MGKNARSLADLVNSRQSSGRYTFRREDALDELGVSEVALRNAARRLIEKRRLAMPRRGFYVIVPVEYREAAAPPAAWFIDDLMAFHGQRYYVGLLSAATVYGAAHQQPQEFQVVTEAPLRPAKAGRSRIRFFTKRHLGGTPVRHVKTETGSMRVSSPEATALDLVRYSESAGHLGNVATVLAELAEHIDGERLVLAAERDVELAHVQRLGYLLELAGASERCEELADWIANRHPRTVLLRPGRPARKAQRNERWAVLANERVEVDR